MALYSALAEALDTVVCFFDLHEIKEDPTKTQNPVIYFLVSEQSAQSELLNIASCKEFSAAYDKPCPGAPLIYLSTLCIAFQ